VISLSKPWQINLLTLTACGVVASMFGPAVYSVARRGIPLKNLGVYELSHIVNLTYLLGCTGLLAILIWKIKKFGSLLTTWFSVAFALGIFGCLIPFGTRPEFCGSGIPIPYVSINHGTMYSNEMALIMNPVLLSVTGIVVIFASYAVSHLYLSWSNHRKPS
jgi:hypothetical protein